MSEVDDAIDQIESHAALYREQRLRAEIERLKTEVWHLQAVNGALKIALREARRALEGRKCRRPSREDEEDQARVHSNLWPTHVGSKSW